jgi:hypothetical protein
MDKTVTSRASNSPVTRGSSEEHVRHGSHGTEHGRHDDERVGSLLEPSELAQGCLDLRQGFRHAGIFDFVPHFSYVSLARYIFPHIWLYAETEDSGPCLFHLKTCDEF